MKIENYWWTADRRFPHEKFVQILHWWKIFSFKEWQNFCLLKTTRK